MRLIDADAFKKYIRDACNEMSHVYKDGGKWAKQITEDFCMDIDEQPTIEERKTGKWLIDPDGRLHCSRCLENPTNRVMIDGRLVYDMTPIVGKMRYCPNCGAKMEEAGSEDIPMEYFESGGR